MSEGQDCRCGYDEELRRYDPVFRQAWGVRAGDHVLDIGCGAGQTTCEAARLASAGSALGIDVSAAAIERARELAFAQGVRNAGFECADAQVNLFPPGRFDLAVSRFGVMFFRDPAAAFANIARALRPDGRLVALAWQDGQRNEWEVAVRDALARAGGPAAGQQAFSLADPPAVADLLEGAGFGDIGFVHLRVPVWYGPDADAAVGWVRGFASVRSVIGRLEPAEADAAVRRLREVMASHADDSGVWFDSRSWIITARRH